MIGCESAAATDIIKCDTHLILGEWSKVNKKPTPKPEPAIRILLAFNGAVGGLLAAKLKKK